MDKLDIIKRLFAVYPNATPTQATYLGYLEVLAEVPTAELDVVVLQCMRAGGSFPPAAGQVLERWTSSQFAPNSAAEGWLSVKKAIRYTGLYGSPKFKDPLTTKTVEAIGWTDLCMSESQGVDRAHFLKIYEMFARSQAEEHRLSQEFKKLRDSALRLRDNNRPKQLEAKDERETALG